MKRIALAATLLTFSGLAAPVLAEADGPDYFRVRNVRANDVLNLRTGPSPSAAKLAEIPHDTDGIRNLGCRGGLSFAQWERATAAQRKAAESRRWCRVEYRGVRGWAAGRFLAEGGPPR